MCQCSDHSQAACTAPCWLIERSWFKTGSIADDRIQKIVIVQPRKALSAYSIRALLHKIGSLRCSIAGVLSSFFKSYDTKHKWKNNPGLTILPVQSAMHGCIGRWTHASRYPDTVEGEQKTRIVGNVRNVKDPARCWFTYALQTLNPFVCSEQCVESLSV